MHSNITAHDSYLPQHAALLSKHAWSDIDWVGRWAILILLGLGVVHAVAFGFSSRSWEDPSSFRKPMLFGFSTGLTLWSLLFVRASMPRSRFTTVEMRCVSVLLLMEVGIIAIQAWRQVPSHFNREGMLNALLEFAMLCGIGAVSLYVVWLCGRSFWPGQLVKLSSAMRMALRSGLVFLVLSCAIGGAITWIGQRQLVEGASPEVYGERGVLKFPHGASLHAIQVLALFAWWCDRNRVCRGDRAVAMAAGAQALFLGYAVDQTAQGQGRWEVNDRAWMWLLAILLTTVASLVLALRTGPLNKKPSQT